MKTLKNFFLVENATDVAKIIPHLAGRICVFSDTTPAKITALTVAKMIGNPTVLSFAWLNDHHQNVLKHEDRWILLREYARTEKAETVILLCDYKLGQYLAERFAQEQEKHHHAHANV